MDRPSHEGLGVVATPPASPTGPAGPTGPHLSQLLLHVAGEESQDSQLGTQWAGHIPQGECFQLSPDRRVADLAVGRGTGRCQLSWSLS